MTVLNNYPDENLIEALEAYAKQKDRAAKNFIPTSAAYKELEYQAALTRSLVNNIKAGSYTPLEEAIKNTPRK